MQGRPGRREPDRTMFSEDRDYVHRFLQGESDVFEMLVRKYNRLGGAIAFGILGDFHQAEDAVQEAFLTAFRSLASLRDPSKFRFWFANLVRTRALDVLRRRRANEEIGLPDGALLGFAAVPTAEDEQIREETRQKILEAIRELPMEDRLVIVLKHMESLSYKEIAELTASTVSAVESRLFRARQTLRKKLDPSKT